MRNAKKIQGDLVVTIDNAGCIGEKEHDIVKASNETTAYYTARVAILEQWCAGAQPIQLFLSNFTSEAAWEEYERGIARVFSEIGEKMPPLMGTTESNFKSLQSGMTLIVIGKQVIEHLPENCQWFVVGEPLLGNEVIEQPNSVAKLNELLLLLKMGVIKQIWPTGSKGIGAECEKLFKGKQIECSLPLDKTGGPSTAVIVGVDKEQVKIFEEKITTPIAKIHIS